jgi:hypothetical protein
MHGASVRLDSQLTRQSQIRLTQFVLISLQYFECIVSVRIVVFCLLHNSRLVAAFSFRPYSGIHTPQHEDYLGLATVVSKLNYHCDKENMLSIDVRKSYAINQVVCVGINSRMGSPAGIQVRCIWVMTNNTHVDQQAVI